MSADVEIVRAGLDVLWQGGNPDGSIRRVVDHIRPALVRVEAALRDEFFKRIRDLDYEVDDPERPNQTVWAWTLDPVYALLGLTEKDCLAALRALDGQECL